MNKQDLITLVGAAAGAVNTPADDALNSIVMGINSRLKNGDSSSISVYDTFAVEEPAVSELTKPKTSESNQISTSTPLC